MGIEKPIGRLTGASLEPPELEEAYRLRFLRADSRIAAGVLGVLALLGETSVLNDARFIADQAVRARLDVVRVAFLFASVILAVVLVRARRPVVADGAYLAWAALGSLFNVAVQSTRPAAYFLPIVESITYVFMLWTMTSGRLAVQALSAAFATAAAATWILAFRDPPSGLGAISLVSSLAIPNVVGGVLAWRAARTRRMQFLALSEAEAGAAAVRQREERLLRMLEALPVPVLYGDGKQRILFVNDEFEAVFGYGIADVPDAARWFELAYPDPEYRGQVMAAWTARVERARAGNGTMESSEVRVRCKDGTDRVVQARGAFHGETLIVAFHDLTDQKRAEEALRRSQDRLQAAVISGQVGIWELDVATLEVWRSPQANKIIGRGDEPATSSMQEVVDLAHPDDQHLLLEGFERVLATGHSVSEIRTHPASGPPRWVVVEGSLYRDAAGQPQRIAGTLVEVTNQRNVEQALRSSERLYRTLARHFPSGVIGLFDAELRLVLLDGQRSPFGPEPSRLVGLRPGQFATPELATRLEGLMQEALGGVERQVELTHGHLIIEAHFFPIRDEAGKVVMGLFVTEDVTQQRGLQAKVAVSGRLAALGTLVAGVAHEINNPLTGELAEQGLALEAVEALQATLDGDGPVDREAIRLRLADVRESLRDAQAAGLRIAAIVRDLSIFGRPDPRRTRVRLLDVVEGAMRWLPASIHGSATIQVENLGPPDVVASPGQIAQVLVNLITNGAKASPPDRRGVVRVRLSPGPEGTARLEVSDDGVGIAPEVMTRIFDPFFTTRAAGQGMGLGLPICHAIVTAHGGTITAASTPGQGATFLVELPAAPDGA